MTNDELVAHIESVIANYEGDADVLASSIGALMIGRAYGWRVLRIVTSSPSYTKYQRILGLEFKSVLPEVTKISERSLGFRIVTKLNNFWQVVKGEAKGEYRVSEKDKRRFASIG